MSIKDAATKAGETVTKALKGSLTDSQWEARVAKSREKLDKLKTDIVYQVTENVSGAAQTKVLDALGLEAPKEPEEFTFTIPVSMDRTYAVLATDQVAAAQKLLDTLGENGDAPAQRFGYDNPVSKQKDQNLNRDVTEVKKVRDAVTETPATETPATPELPLIERFAALEAEYEDLVSKARDEARWLNTDQSLCLEGVNRVLRKLNIEPLPEKKYFTVEVPVSGAIRGEVSAFTEEEARERMKEYADTNQGNGRLTYGTFINPVVTGEPRNV